MIELQNWIDQNKIADKPWLVLGKGPTFARIKEVDLQQYNTFALNHVVRETRVDVAHIVDIDVVEAVGDSLLENCSWLIIPRTPHVKCYASEYFRLEDWINCIPVLCQAEKQGKLITYTFSHEPREFDPWTIVCRYFSSEAALGILGRMGAKTVCSLGIDGGKNYSATFTDLKETLLVNSQPSFDLQFDELKAIAKQYNIDYAPLFQVDPETICGAPFKSKDATSAKSSPVILTTATRIQQLERDYRAVRSELITTQEELAKTSKDLDITRDRLGWARDEIAEYRTRVLQLEKEMHSLCKSLSWKIGRLVTKPAEVLSSRFKQSTIPARPSSKNASCTKLAED